MINVNISCSSTYTAEVGVAKPALVADNRETFAKALLVASSTPKIPTINYVVQHIDMGSEYWLYHLTEWFDSCAEHSSCTHSVQVTLSTSLSMILH